ncbi:hypothetical protein HPB48_020964 [Haemaphysalis longicornis]|uniref:SWIM-type domain-containing protein n=1 Tax=Haemaphysalis longicornis TaxID=44386 RepID=A0A9J6FDL7_HAELO|nr:hypothetical protein HPB48_020964 [Haemaphysalis longicornis]
MRSTIQKYAKNVLCLDATYKTTDYALPLFLLVVPTPVGYVTVGAFIVQFETAEHIEEALRKFKEWCPDLNPKYWMVDCNLAEMNAITATFPQAHIAICDFHREQAWERWCSRRENNIDKPQVLALLRKIARALTEEDYEAALHDLQTSSYWQDSEQLRQYFSRQWLPLKHCWVKCFLTDLQISTNNGTEAQNRKLKECYLKNCSGRRSLAGLVDVLTNQFFPDCEKEFHLATVSSTSEYRMFHSSVPSYLHNRPPAVIKHVMQRLHHAAAFSAHDVKATAEHGLFIVQSETSQEETYSVNFTVPSCGCRDFIRHQLPCKHFCAVFNHQKDWGFDSLPEGYRSGPLLTLATGPSPGEAAADSPNHSTTMDAAPGHSGAEESGDQSAPFPGAAPESFCELPRHQKDGMGHKRRQILSGLEKCKSIVHYCNSVESLEKALELVNELSSVLQEGTPACSGLSLRSSPTKGCSGQKKRKLESTPHVATQKLQRYTHPNKEHWRTKGRVGARADSLRQAYTMPQNQVQ